MSSDIIKISRNTENAPINSVSTTWSLFLIIITFQLNYLLTLKQVKS